MENQNVENLNESRTNTMVDQTSLRMEIWIGSWSYRCNRGSQGFDPKGRILSYPGNMAKSNSNDLQTSPVSSLELHSNNSLCQKSDILLIH